MDITAIDRARSLLDTPSPRQPSAWAGLGAAALAAASALMMAGAVIVGPGFVADPTPIEQAR